MKVIAFSKGSGVSIVYPTGEIPIEEVLAKDVPKEHRSAAQIVDSETLPDPERRADWVIKGKKVVVG